MGAGRAAREQWDGEAYAAQSEHHRRFDDWFLERHLPRPGDDVVDLGSGSGEFTAQLAELVGDGTVVGIEPDPSMLMAARRRVTASNVKFIEGRAQQLSELRPPTSADLVISRAMFHWIPLDDYPRVYESVRRVLRPGGCFHAESGGAGNAHRVVPIMDEVASQYGLGLGADGVTFPHPAVVLEFLEEAGLEVPEEGVRTVAQRRSFDREGLIGFLRTQAAAAYIGGASDETCDAFLDEVTRRVDEFRRADGSYDQTFVRLEVLCRAPE